jgi:hypothetical protein
MSFSGWTLVACYAVLQHVCGWLLGSLLASLPCPVAHTSQFYRAWTFWQSWTFMESPATYTTRTTPRTKQEKKCMSECMQKNPQSTFFYQESFSVIICMGSPPPPPPTKPAATDLNKMSSGVAAGLVGCPHLFGGGDRLAGLA